MSEKLTYKQLKSFLDTLTEDQLNHPVTVWGEGVSLKGKNLGTLEEMYLCNGEFYQQYSIVKESTDPDDFNEANFPIVGLEGQPIIYVD